LEDVNISLSTNTVIANIYGKTRVSGVDVVKVENGQIVGQVSHITCDTIIISADLIPEDSILKTKKDSIFVCKNALFVHGLVDDVSNSGEEVAAEIKSYLSGDYKKLEMSKYIAKNILQTRKAQAEFLYNKKLEEVKYKDLGTITCIKCPNGCEIGKLFNGGKCDKGAEYAKEELANSSRVLTSSIKVVGGEHQLISVNTTAPIPKSMLSEGMRILKDIVIEAPV